MSTPEFAGNPYESPPPKRGGGKWLLGLGIGCGVVVLLCCGGAFVTFYFAGSWFGKSVSTDPGTINNTAAQIAQLDLPDEFEPTHAINLKMPFIETTLMTGALYEEKASHSLLGLAAGQMISAADPKQIRVQVQQTLEGTGAHHEELRQAQMAEKTITVRGKPCSFMFVSGKAAEDKGERIQVFGVFPGKTGQAAIIIDADAKKYPQARLEKVLESIK